VREWLDAKPDPQFAEKCHDIYQTYRLAPERAAAGIPTFSIDEMTDIQALERIAPTLPVRPGRVERREFEYTRHGTCTLIASFNVATGAASADIGETRTEEDFAAHLAAPVQQPRMHLAMDNLNTHYSESAVRLVAERIGFEGDLGRKGRCGILRNHGQTIPLDIAPHRLTTRFDHKRYHYFCSAVLGFLDRPALVPFRFPYKIQGTLKNTEIVPDASKKQLQRAIRGRVR